VAFLPQYPERALAGRNLAEDLSGTMKPGSHERKRLRERLVSWGVPGELGRPSSTLSLSQRRRVTLAMVEQSGHDAWALDQPDTGLDRAGKRMLRNWLRSAAPSAGLWISTHDFGLYAPLNPFWVVLDRGRVVATGEPHELLAREEVFAALGLGLDPRCRLWQAIVKAFPGLDENVWKTLAPGGGRIAQVQALLRDTDAIY